MSFELETSEDLSPVGAYLDKPGWYHLVITEVREDQSSKGKPIDGFSAEMSVLAGTVDSQEGKKTDLTFWKPKSNDTEDQQSRTRKANTAFAIATNLLDPNQLGKKVNVELSQAVDQQVIAQLEYQQEKDANGNWVDNEKFLRLRFSNIYHVDDPEVAKIPKNADALELLDKSKRRGPEFFAFKKKAKAAAAAPQSQTAAASSGGNWDNL